MYLRGKVMGLNMGETSVRIFWKSASGQNKKKVEIGYLQSKLFLPYQLTRALIYIWNEYRGLRITLFLRKHLVVKTLVTSKDVLLVQTFCRAESFLRSRLSLIRQEIPQILRNPKFQICQHLDPALNGSIRHTG